MFSSSLPTFRSTSSCYYSLLLKILGTMTQFKAGVFVPYQEVIDCVLVAAGIDLNNLPTTLPRKNLSPPGLDRTVSIAFRCLRERSPALTLQGTRKGYWGLTEEGVEKALGLQEVEEVQEVSKVEEAEELSSNDTHKWFQTCFPPKQALEDNTYYQAMTSAVRRSLPVSVEAQQEMDHVHACIAKLLSRDAFAKKIRLGLQITPSHMATYAVRSSWTDIRDAATEPLSRELWGAKTSKELKKQSKDIRTPASAFQVSWHDTDTDSPSWDLHDPDTKNVLSEIEDFDKLKNILNELHRRLQVLKHNAKPALRTLLLRMQGNKVPEIAEKMKKTNRQVTRLLSEARKVLGDDFKAYVLQS